MTTQQTDLVIVGAGPVGLMCAYLARLSGLSATVLDQSEGPLKVGRADALNARTLQLLELVGLFDELYPLGKPCNTSSVWADGRFVSRQSSWWDELEGCQHKHFLMLGQSYLEQLLDTRAREAGAELRRLSPVVDVRLTETGCVTELASGETIASRVVIGADGSRSLVRELFKVPFELTRPRIVWAVLDGVIETDFPKVPEIIVFQAETSDVAWIPREGDLDRFYVRMDTKDFELDQVLARINRAMRPHTMRVKELVWSSKFSVKESVAESFAVQDRVFLVGDACHVHSVNGGQGLNTGLGDAFNLIWKLARVLRSGAGAELLKTYEDERKPVALSVVETSGELVRSTKHSANATHARDYVEIVRKRAGNITGMGVRYGEQGLIGSRLFDLEVRDGARKTRLYSLLSYAHSTWLVFGEHAPELRKLPDDARVVHVRPTKGSPYDGQAILVRPDSYIEAIA